MYQGRETEERGNAQMQFSGSRIRKHAQSTLGLRFKQRRTTFGGEGGEERNERGEGGWWDRPLFFF